MINVSEMNSFCRYLYFETVELDDSKLRF